MMIAVSDPVSVVLIQYGAVGAVAIMALAAVRVLYLRITETVRTEYLVTLAKATEAISDALAAVRRG
jgi:hypothetical protein